MHEEEFLIKETIKYDKNSIVYFMTHMSQEEFNEIRKGHKTSSYEFNKIKKVKDEK